MKTCPQCKANNEENSFFCTGCGHKLYDRAMEKSKRKTPETGNVLLIKGIPLDPLFFIAFGLIVVIIWFIIEANTVALFSQYYIEMKPLLWFTLHSRLYMSTLLLLLGVIITFLSKKMLLLIGNVFLFLNGILNIAIDFLAIPALGQYNENVQAIEIFRDINFIWIIIGVLQISVALILMIKYKQA